MHGDCAQFRTLRSAVEPTEQQLSQQTVEIPNLRDTEASAGWHNNREAPLLLSQRRPLAGKSLRRPSSGAGRRQGAAKELN